MGKILVVGPAWVGDMVMAQSLLLTLRQTHPDAVLSVLAPAWSAPLLQRMPEVAQIIPMPLGHGELELGVRRRLGRELRRVGFDWAIVLPGSFKSALIPWFARIPRRTGYVGEQRWGLLNDIRRLDRRAAPLNVQRFVALGLPKGAAVVGEEAIPRPRLLAEPARAAATAARLGLDTAAPVVALCPGAEYGPAKRWPPAHFAEVANRQLDAGKRVWLFGGQNDRFAAARINWRCAGRCDDLTGRTSLGEAVDLLSLAAHAVTNDTGLMHIAAATGCHVVALYGSSSDAFTPPLTARADRLSLGLECSPCFRRECPLGHLDCLNRLAPERALAALARAEGLTG